MEWREKEKKSHRVEPRAVAVGHTCATSKRGPKPKSWLKAKSLRRMFLDFSLSLLPPLPLFSSSSRSLWPLEPYHYSIIFLEHVTTVKQGIEWELFSFREVIIHGLNSAVYVFDGDFYDFFGHTWGLLGSMSRLSVDKRQTLHNTQCEFTTKRFSSSLRMLIFACFFFNQSGSLSLASVDPTRPKRLCGWLRKIWNLIRELTNNNNENEEKNHKNRLSGVRCRCSHLIFHLFETLSERGKKYKNKKTHSVSVIRSLAVSRVSKHIAYLVVYGAERV